MRQTISTLITLLLCIVISSAQEEAIKSDTASSEAALLSEISMHQTTIDSLKHKLNEVKKAAVKYPYWIFGGGALSGFDFNNFSNWASRGENINSSASSFTLGANGFADKKGENYFWRNRAKLNLGWQRFQRSDTDEDVQFEKIADMLRLVTHYGYNICPEVAMSALSEWESNLIGQEINVSYLDLSLGFTWTPDESFVSIMHPVNYELAVGSDENFESSLGAKLIFEYNKTVEKHISLASQFSGFLSYEEVDFLSNFTWTNGVNVKVLKGLGLGLEYALRISQQETIGLNLTDEHFQSYFVMGMSFEFI